MKRKLILLGWDSADWKVINKLIDKGEMPSMKKLKENGAFGNLSTLDPPFSPMLWTTIATGVRPDKHGILGFSEPSPDKAGVRPVSSTSRKVKAIWNIFNQSGLKSHIVGWWPSHPVEPINGIMLSNYYQKVSNNKEKWKLANGTVHPAELKGFFEHLRVHPSEITQEHLIPFVPNAKEVDQEKDKHLYQIAKNLAETSTIQAAATWILDTQDWDFVAAYWDNIDHVSHGFMNFRAPKMFGVEESQFQLYKDVVDGIYKFHDMMLGRVMEMVDENTTIMVISDHGFHSDHLRPNLLPDEPAAPAFQHRDYGIFCVSGPGIKKGEQIFGASLLDITPTILSLYNLPIGKDMEGKPLTQIYKDLPKLSHINSWEDIDGNVGTHSKEYKEDPYAANEAIQQLIELGYIEDPGDNVKLAVEKTIDESEYNLCRVYIGSNRHHLAIPILEKLFNKYKDKTRFGLRLVECYLETSNLEKVRSVLTILRSKISSIIKENENKIKEIKEGDEDYIKNKTNLLVSIKNNAQDFIRIDMYEAELLLKENKPNEAIEILNKASKNINPQISLLNRIGNTYLKLEQFDKSIEIFEKILKIDKENHLALDGLSIAYYKIGMYEKSIESSLSAINLIYHFPSAHMHLAQALFEVNAYEQASQALEVCLSMAPNFGVARNLLIDIYDNYIGNNKLSKSHKDYFINKEKNQKFKNKEVKEDTKKVNSKIKNFKESIIVVSGLPRSGTSMMMQMLESGGVEIFTDQKREKDENNPKGYYEHENVKRLPKDKVFLNDLNGKAVKIISHLLIHLPDKHNYKIIFMIRDLNEVISSQQKMLVRLDKKRQNTYPVGLEMAFKKNIEQVKIWVSKHQNVDILYVNHRDVINNTSEQVNKIKTFLNINLQENNMLNVVDVNLYREKA